MKKQPKRRELVMLSQIETRIRGQQFDAFPLRLGQDADLARLASSTGSCEAGEFMLLLLQRARQKEREHRAQTWSFKPFSISLIQPKPGENCLSWLNRASDAITKYWAKPA